MTPSDLRRSPSESGQIEALLDSTNALDQLVDLHLMPGIGFVTRVDFA